MHIAFFVLFLFSNSIQDVVMSRSSSASSPKQFVKANERYSEELVLIASCTNAVECKEILITALFEFAIDDVEMTRRDTLTAPKGLTEIARESDAELVSIAFARGRWSENARGARAFNFERAMEQGRVRVRERTSVFGEVGAVDARRRGAVMRWSSIGICEELSSAREIW
jgi:hypothetical protein